MGEFIIRGSTILFLGKDFRDVLREGLQLLYCVIIVTMECSEKYYTMSHQTKHCNLINYKLRIRKLSHLSNYTIHALFSRLDKASRTLSYQGSSAVNTHNHYVIRLCKPLQSTLIHHTTIGNVHGSTELDSQKLNSDVRGFTYSLQNHFSRLKISLLLACMIVY